MDQRQLVDGEVAGEEFAPTTFAARLGQALTRVGRQLSGDVLLIERRILRILPLLRRARARGRLIAGLWKGLGGL